MAFNFFGALGAFSRALPGYVQGERMAVQDNWNDLNQYNKVQSGQIQNAWDEAVLILVSHESTTKRRCRILVSRTAHRITF